MEKVILIRYGEIHLKGQNRHTLKKAVRQYKSIAGH